MACLKTPLICLVLMSSVKSSQAQQNPSLANISVAEAAAAASNAKHWMQMQNSGRTSGSGSGCSNDKCVESCKQDWEKSGDHCYLWRTDKMNWTSAEDFCQREGGHLASVLSTATFNFVLEGMKNRTGLDSQYGHMAWLGGNDIEVEGTWKWVDCSPWNATFWARGEPNSGRSENCMHLVLNWNGWNDVPCNREQGFLCSKRICSGDSAHSVATESAVTDKSVTGESVMWRSASISLAATLLLIIFF